MPSAAHPPTRTLGFLCLLVTSLGWGLNWPAMKVLLRELPPLFARGAAGSVAGLVCVLAALVLGQTLVVPRALVGRLVAASALNVFAWMGFATVAMRWLSVSQCALLVYTMPVWATLLAWPIRGEQPTLRATAGLVLCMGGLWYLFGSGGFHLGGDQLFGAALALGSALGFALSTVALRPLVELRPVASLAWQLSLGCIPMLVLGLTIERPALAEVSATGWALMLYMTAVPMGLCYLSWFAALRRLPPTTASLATLLTPVIGVVAAAFVVGEPLGLREVAALGLTLGGVALALRKTA
ncbi:DMT family transporter [Piscinibacter koreensis]|uniref:DMT family transporter n=1 Tax=Piscinibacter koreensis TaxID=2742824 RepID=UPI0031598B23